MTSPASRPPSSDSAPTSDPSAAATGSRAPTKTTAPGSGRRCAKTAHTAPKSTIRIEFSNLISHKLITDDQGPDLYAFIGFTGPDDINDIC